MEPPGPFPQEVAFLVSLKSPAQWHFHLANSPCLSLLRQFSPDSAFLPTTHHFLSTLIVPYWVNGAQWSSPTVTTADPLKGCISPKVHANLKQTVLNSALPQPPECWDYKHVSPSLMQSDPKYFINRDSFLKGSTWWRKPVVGNVILTCPDFIHCHTVHWTGHKPNLVTVPLSTEHSKAYCPVTSGQFSYYLVPNEIKLKVFC
jgi:hypothetical protein